MNKIKPYLIQTAQLAVALIIVFGVSYVVAWTGPTSTPPGGNVDAPLNVGSVDQTKIGDLCTTNGGAGTSCLSTVNKGRIIGVRTYGYVITNNISYCSAGTPLFGASDDTRCNVPVPPYGSNSAYCNIGAPVYIHGDGIMTLICISTAI